MAAVLYLDRVCWGQANKQIRDDLGLTNTQMSLVMMAFTLAYGLFEIPSGRLGDRFGSRAVLTRIVIWWSLFTALTGACHTFLALLLVRFLFGAGEAGAFPNAARVIARWYPVGERGRVQGALLTASQLGGAAAPALAAALMVAVGWRWTFVAFGAVGLVWAVGFWPWFRDDPAGHPGVNAAELSTIRAGCPPPTADPGPVPWRVVLTSRGVIALGAIMVIAAFFSYFFYSWFPTYLGDARGVGDGGAGWLASLVLGGAALGVFLGGFVSDRITRLAPDPARTRRRLGVACYSAAAGFLVLGVRADAPVAVAGLFALAACALHLTLPNWWSCAIPEGGRHVGAVFGLMNGVGVVGALASQGFVGVFTDWQKARGLTGRGQWDPLFDVYVVVLVCGAVAWGLYRPSRGPDGTISQS